MTTPRRPNDLEQEYFSFSWEHPAPGTAVAPVAATGLITCVTNALMADSDYITIGDGLTAPKLYEYDKTANGVTGGRVSWAAGAGTAAQTAATLKTAIEATQPALAVTDNLDGTLSLAHKFPGAGGNVTITENVSDAGFLVAGMSGGAASDTTGATLAIKLMTAQRAMRIDKVEYVNPTGLTGHATNYWEIALKKGSTVMAQWSTDSDVAGQGTLTANTIVNPVLSATVANTAAAAADVLSLALTKAASAANLPAGRLIVHGRYV